MSFGSTVPYAKDGLVTTIAARSAISSAPVKVLREWPRSEEDTVSGDAVPEAVWIGREGAQDVTGVSRVTVFTAGVLRFDESYTCWATVQVRHPDGSMESASERAYQIMYEMVAAVANTPRLGISWTGEVARFEVVGFDFNEATRYLGPGGAGCQIEVGFQCEARIEAT